jgi:hypothetical protein
MMPVFCCDICSARCWQSSVWRQQTSQHAGWLPWVTLNCLSLQRLSGTFSHPPAGLQWRENRTSVNQSADANRLPGPIQGQMRWTPPANACVKLKRTTSTRRDRNEQQRCRAQSGQATGRSSHNARPCCCAVLPVAHPAVHSRHQCECSLERR